MSFSETIVGMEANPVCRFCAYEHLAGRVNLNVGAQSLGATIGIMPFAGVNRRSLREVDLGVERRFPCAEH